VDDHASVGELTNQVVHSSVFWHYNEILTLATYEVEVYLAHIFGSSDSGGLRGLTSIEYGTT
jgi:hypothetical protein